MAFDSKGLDTYIDVAQRIADFRARYPDGSLQPADPGSPFDVRKVEGVGKDGKPFTATFITYTAACYRTPHDTRPGIGVAWEVFPGRTPYTLGSELMNAETSAWGRAIVAALASDSKRGVSSREEIRNRAAEQDGEPQPPRPLEELPRNRDGSVSRSRCTEEELEFHGFLRGKAKAEHDALRAGADGKLAPQDEGRFQGCSPGNPCREADCPQCTPDADLWTGEQERPPSPGLRRPEPALKMTDAIRIHFERLGYTDRDVRLGMTAQLAGRTERLRTSKDLTASEGIRVRAALASCKDAAALDRKLKEVSAGA
jgi:hypothetical protein